MQQDGHGSQTAQPLSSGRRNYMLGIFVVIYTINFVDRTILNVLVQPIKEDLDLTDTQIGLVSGVAFGIFYGIMGLPFARIAESRSRRDLICVALAGWSLMTAACGLAQNFWHLFAARLGIGIGEAGCTPAAQSMLSDVFPQEQRSTALSIYSMGVPIGTLFGALFGGWIGQEFGWRMAFLVVGVPGLAVALLARLTVPDVARGLGEGGVTAKAPPLGVALRTMAGLPAFRHLTAAFTYCALAGYSLNLFYVAYLQRAHGLSLVQASFAFGLVSGVTGILGMFIGGVATDRLARRDPRMQCWLPAGALVLTAPLLIAGLVQSDVWMMAVFVVPAGILYPMYVGTGFAAAHNLVEPRMRATATAVLLMIATIVGMGIGPAATGAISDMATRSLFEGDFDRLCRVAVPMAGCGPAQAQGLLIAMVAAATCYLLGAAHLAFAGSRLVRRPSCTHRRPQLKKEPA